MPLMRGKAVGYDVAKMTFRFTMLNEGETVKCEISSVAMDELGGKRGILSGDREAQFDNQRQAIEHIASNIFDDGVIVQGAIVRIFAKHIRR
jgi:hypothetical protein